VEKDIDTAAEEVIPLLQEEAEKSNPKERRFINFIITILKSPFTLLKYVVGLFLIVDDPSKTTIYHAPAVFGVLCTGENYTVIVSDPPDDPPNDPLNKVVSVPLDPDTFRKVLVNGKESACSWSGRFGENEYAFCETDIPVTSLESVDVQLIGPDINSNSGMSGPCFEDELPEKPF